MRPGVDAGAETGAGTVPGVSGRCDPASTGIVAGAVLGGWVAATEGGGDVVTDGLAAADGGEGTSAAGATTVSVAEAIAGALGVAGRATGPDPAGVVTEATAIAADESRARLARARLAYRPFG